MSNSTNMSLEEHKSWTESVSQRLDRIYKELCEYEEYVLNKEIQEDRVQLMELLETIDELHTATKSIRNQDKSLESRQYDLQQQMQLLQQSIELLKLEPNCKCNNLMIE